MKNWSFGIIGAGVIADFHAKAITHIPNARVIGFCDGGSGRARELAERYQGKYFSDYMELVSSREIDIVTIATPSGFHMEPAIAAAEHGKHVLCEKPLEISLERIDAMIRAHEQHGTYLGGIFNFRYIDAIGPFKKAIDSGRFCTIT